MVCRVSHESPGWYGSVVNDSITCSVLPTAWYFRASWVSRSMNPSRGTAPASNLLRSMRLTRGT
jgi:hypothetical protein